VWGVLSALSFIVTVPVRGPKTVGMKVTLIAQEDPAAKLIPQLFDCEKSPLIVMLEMASTMFPLLESVMVWTALGVFNLCAPNAKAVADSAAAGIIPVPMSAIIWGEFGALSLRLTDPPLAPMAEGLKVLEIVQLAPMATLLPQVFVCAKSEVVVRLVIFKMPVPVLVRMTA